LTSQIIIVYELTRLLYNYLNLNMKTMKHATLLTILLCLVCFSAIAQTATPRTDFSFTIGTVFPGKIQAAWHSDFKPNETFDFKNAQCLLIKMSADRYLLPGLSIGVCMNYVPIKIQDVNSLGIEDVTIHMGEIDGTLKGRFQVSKAVVLKPGVALGYRRTFSSEPNARESGFCLNAGVECQYHFGEKYFLLGDLGFFTQPYGGVVDVVYVRAGPVFYAAIGFGFSL